MARAETKTARADEPVSPCDEAHGDGTTIVRHHLGLSIREHVIIEMAKGIVSSPDTAELSFSEVSERALQQAESLLQVMS